MFHNLKSIKIYLNCNTIAFREEKEYFLKLSFILLKTRFINLYSFTSGTGLFTVHNVFFVLVMYVHELMLIPQC